MVGWARTKAKPARKVVVTTGRRLECGKMHWWAYEC